MTLHERTGIAFALKHAAEELKAGIGKKKRVTKFLNGGQSPLIHSYSTFNRYMGVAKQFVQYCKERGVNKIVKIDESVVLSFFRERKIAADLTEKTIKVNLCAIEKFLETIGRQDIADSVREQFSQIYSQGRASGRTEYFSHPEEVIKYLRDDAHKRIAELQYLTGARISDIKKIKIDMLFQQVIFTKSKGGKNRVLDFSDRHDILQRIDQLCDELRADIATRRWQSLREGYYHDLRQAVQRVGEIYTGAHAFRANYARERRDELIAFGFNVNKADKVVSEELGHRRPSMGRYYST